MNENISVFDIEKIPTIQPKNKTDVIKEPLEKDDSLNALTDMFGETRKKTTKQIKQFSERLRDFEELTALAVDLYSTRQIFVEDRYKMYELVNKLNKNLKTLRRNSLDSVKTSNLLIKQKDEKGIYMDADTASLDYKIDIMNNHVNFLDATIKNIDNLIWGIKICVDIQKIKNGII